MIDGEKLIRFFTAIYDEEEEITEQRKDIAAQMKGYAENIEVQPSALKSAYGLFKRYHGGKNTQNDCEEYAEMSGIIENFFATENEGN